MLDISEADIRELQRFTFDSEVSVLVVWIDQGIGCFEYAIERMGSIVEVSDQGYGTQAAAMRDGLSHLLGDL